ncbi:MAG: lysophospholipid acyltransferase family protein [Planctomycetota bacterium]
MPKPTEAKPSDNASENSDKRALTAGNNPRDRNFIWKVCQSLTTIACKTFFDYKSFGTHHIPRYGGVLVLSNHQSYLDPPLLGLPMRRPMAYLAKSELFKNPLFGGLIRQLNAFPVRQGAGDIGAMRESIKLLQEGWLLNVFPEGLRTPDGELKPSQKGGALMVRKAGVPVVPAVIDGSFNAWPRNQKFPRSKPVRVMYGPPVELAHRKAGDILKWTDDTLAEMLGDLRAGRVHDRKRG